MKTLEGLELQVAEEVLKKHFPRSYKVYGFLHSINRGKPTILEVVVDAWPDFKVIICRPDLANRHVMDYTLKVTIFSMDEQIFRMMLENTVDWRHNFLFAGLDASNEPIIREVSAMKNINQKTYTNAAVHLLYLPNISDLNSPTVDGELGLRITSLDLSHVDLVNNTWKFGGNERAYRNIKRSISNFPTCCIKDELDQPVSWILVYDYCAIGILYTVPEHRGKGYGKVLVSALAKRLYAEGYPIYCFIEQDNTVSYKLFKSLGFTEDSSYRAVWLDVNTPKDLVPKRS
ncbi:glycine N-acyltransferase-like protein 3 [Eucyclogobius newberryi]|uniref:glycine N-acyltransferase-like protein 3 n=1 Tax=Eucyclogobius newberryi TaxID=166745 RepID=UPI003B5C8FCE